MELECDCGAVIIFPTAERVLGFIVSSATCSECGQVWKARIVKSKKVELE